MLARIACCLASLVAWSQVKAEPSAVRLMSFNIRMGAGQEGPFRVEPGTLGYLPQCAEVIKAANPDVVGIQEIDRKTNRAAGLDETAELAKLCGLHGTFVPKLKLPGGDYGLAILSKEKPLSVETYYMKGSAHTRALMVCEFADYILANTHFPLKAELCTDASYIVRAKLFERKKPVFFMGDLNSRPNSEAIKSLQKELEILSDTTVPTFPAKAPDRTIDYVMVDKAHASAVSVAKRQVIAAPQATDHCALVVDVKLARLAVSSGVNPLFRDHMVFPAGKTLRVFGTGTDSAKVRFLGHEASAACKDGRWLVELPAAEAGGPYELVIECDGVKTVVKDVWVGEVILLAGQSNMQFRLDQDTSADEPHPTNVLLRSYMIDRLEKHGMDKEADGWVVATPEAVRRWSAIGYHLGTIRTAQQKVAVGLVNCYQGASTIQTWMPKALAEDARFALPEGGKLHGDDSAPTYAVWNQPWGKLYETMFMKVVPFAFSQVVWYQGESNTGHLEGTVYADRLVAMIDRWRADLQDPALPFTLVQIADFQWRRDDDWRSVQAAQLTVPSRMKGVKTVRSADISDHEIHPSSKRPLAVRISDAMDPPRKNPAFAGLFSDPELLWSEQTGRCYIYPSTDGFPPDWREDKAYAFSSADMRTWRKDGCVFDLKRDCSWADIKLWAPCAIERCQPDGSWKYYWYFAAEQKLGVAVGERPEGPFRDALGHPLLAKHLDAKGRYYQLIDPDVFCDPQTGKCHLYWGNACMVRAELKPSMTEIGEPQFLIDRDTCAKFHYNEGTHVFFRKGLYYFSWSEFGTEDPRYCVRYLISDSPTEFVRNGKPAEVEPEPLVSRVEEKKILGTGHHSVVCKPGTDEWYVAYHRFCVPNVEKGGNPAFNREVCVDRLEFAPDGRIIRVTCTP